MCSGLFSKPKVSTPVVEQVAPAPQNVSGSESKAVGDQLKEQNKKRRAMVGADQMRSVLTDAAQGKQTLG